MKVICIQNEINETLAEKVYLSEREPRIYRSISPGKEYVVLGITYAPSSSCYAGVPTVEIKNDNGGLSVVPLFMFDVIDSSASRYWDVRFDGGTLTMLPESFYAEFYHDDLSEGVPEILHDFNEVYKKIEFESLETTSPDWRE